jgi:hypothetical protein
MNAHHAKACLSLCFVCLALVPNAVADSGPVFISEFMAANANDIRDEDGERSDWIELHNAGAVTADLTGWFLTDDPANLGKWRLPAASLAPDGFLVVWASSKDRTNDSASLHTNFRLDKGGEFLALVDPSSNVVSSYAPAFPAQQSDISFGRDSGDPSITGFFSASTPGAANAISGPEFAPALAFSHGTGIYTNDSLALMIAAGPGAVIYYTLDGSMPSTNSAVYSGPLVIGTNVTIKARAFESGLLPGPIAARSFVFLDASTRDFDSNLPLMILSTGGQVPADVPPGGMRRNGGLFVIDRNNGGRAALRDTPQFAGLADFELFGQTSLYFPKRPHRIELQDEYGHDRNASLLGLPADADWQLQNPYNDKSFLNDFLAAELHERMGRTALRRKFVEVFVDSGTGKLSYPQDYYGIMVLFEKIEVDRNRVNIAELTPANTAEPEISGGYIFKRDKDSAGDLNFSSPGGYGFANIPFKLHEPKPNELRNAGYWGFYTSFPNPLSGPSGPIYTSAGSNQLAWLRNYLGQMERVLYTNDWLTRTATNHYSHYLDVDSAVDQHWIVEFTKQIDGYRLSSFYTKDRNGKVKMEPIWGWKLSFGNADYASGDTTNGWYYELTGEQDHPWLRRLICGTTSPTGSSGDPDFVQRIADRWSVLRTNVLNGTNVIARIGELAARLNEPATRDFAKYPRLGTYTWPNPDGPQVDYTNPTNYLGRTTNSIIGQMTRWMLGRYLWIDGQFTKAPVFSLAGGSVSNGTLLKISTQPGGTIYYTLDGTDPRAPGGGVALNAQTYSGPITLSANSRVFARAKRNGAWKNTWSGPAVDTFYTALPTLRITEIMYYPGIGAPGTDAEDFEFIEVRNIGVAPLNVSAFTIGGGVQFTFPNTVLAAGDRAVVVKNTAAFQSRYGMSAVILGEFAGHLSNNGDRLVLRGSLGELIQEITYSNMWHPTTDGAGFSLVVVDETASGIQNSATTWRPSSAVGGSPGLLDPPLARAPVVVNEILAHAESPLSVFVELHNPTGESVDVNGWFLTDDLQEPQKLRISSPAIIPANGFLVLDEAALGFGSSNVFRATGGAVFLFSGDGTNLTGHAHGFPFGASDNGVSFGRYITSTSEEEFVAQQQRTPNQTNAGPLVGPVVINEIMFQPHMRALFGVGIGDNTADEFIELRNVSSNSVSLFDPSRPTNRWRLGDAVEFTFAENVVLSPNSSLLVVGFDPVADATTTAAFRAHNFVPDDVPLYGPWIGNLNNAAANVELLRPMAATPGEDGAVRFVLVEHVRYSSAQPWPTGAGGTSLSLQRITPASYGNDPANWTAAAPTPGSDFVEGIAPQIISQPGDQNVIFGTNVTVTAEVTGTPPLRYQWGFEGQDLSDATNTSLVLSNFSGEQVGIYNVRVFNSGGIAFSSNFTILGRIALQIVQPPMNRVVALGSSTNFTVTATASRPLTYQWQHNGNVLANATAAVLTLTNIQTTNEGNYAVVVTDGIDTIVSPSATLTLVYPPVWRLQPIGQTCVEGGSVTFSAAMSGTMPIYFRWRTNGITFTNAIIVNTPSNSTLTLHNVSTNFNGMRFDVAPTNIAGQGVLSTRAFLTVLRDSDHDGLPDIWEQGRPGFDPNDASDAARDDDGDTMNNRDEYIAGTDYLDPSSYLKVELALTGGATVQFMAISNRTYTIQYSDAVPVGWLKLVDVLARTSNRVEVVTDPASTAKRFYRLATPVQP